MLAWLVESDRMRRDASRDVFKAAPVFPGALLVVVSWEIHLDELAPAEVGQWLPSDQFGAGRRVGHHGAS